MTDSAPESDDAGTVTRLRGVRLAAAKHMITAWSAPAFHVAIDIEMTAANSVKTRTPGSTISDVILRACARALVDQPTLNAWYEDDFNIRTFATANVGLAVAAPQGLVVPVIHNADQLTLPEIVESRREAVDRSRSATLKREDITGGTFTISNLGMLGVVQFDAILNPPQVAILAIAATRNEYIRTPHGARWRPLCRFTLTCDHRAVDGAAAALFLNRLKELLESDELDLIQAVDEVPPRSV